MYRVYIAAPISKGNKIHNLAQALEAYELLLRHGYAPFCPHLSMLVDDVLGRIPYETWIATDLEWVAVSHLVVRLPGESPGADGEVKHANWHDVPVILRTVEELKDDLEHGTFAEYFKVGGDDGTMGD